MLYSDVFNVIVHDVGIDIDKRFMFTPPTRQLASWKISAIIIT